MRSNQARSPRAPFIVGADPRETGEAQVIDLTTRTVLPAVAQRGRKSDSWGVAAGISVVAALGAITLYVMNSARENPHAAPRSVQGGALQAPMPGLARPAGLPQGVPGATGVPLPGAPGAGFTQPQPVFANAPQAGAAVAPAASPQAGQIVVFDASAMPAPSAQTGAGAGSGNPLGAGASSDEFANRIGGIGGNTATARAMVDPKTTVTQGTLIPAILETAINTDVPGYTRAVVSADVRSFDGSRVLIPRSSRLIGQYKSGLQAGQKRAYVIWTRLIRPDGVSVNIASPAASYSGENGLAGSVNSHFFERFGSAMLLSLVGGLSSIGGGATTAIITGGGQSAAAAAVGQSGQIGPTVRVRQGEPIRVFTARDLDFSKVTTG